MRSSDADRSPSVADRVFVVLQSCGATEQAVTLADLVGMTGLPKTTLHRVCWKLVELGMLEHSEAGFRIGTKLFELGGMNPQLRRLRATAMPYLHTLATRTGSVVNLAVRSDARALIVDEVFSGATPDLRRMVGASMPLHATAIGKALLAAESPEALEELLGPDFLRPYTRWTIVRPNLMREHLAEVRRAGVAFSREEWRLGTAGVAAPVTAGSSGLAALAVVGVVGSPEQTLRGPTAELVRRAAASLSRALVPASGVAIA